jgi:hypothetical protein
MRFDIEAVVACKILKLSIESTWSNSNLGHVVVEDRLRYAHKVFECFLMTFDERWDGHARSEVDALLARVPEHDHEDVDIDQFAS